MDIVKDTQAGNNLSHLLEEQRVRTNPFGRNRSGERLYSRAERVVAALHLITNHVPQGEPVRVSTREEGVKLLAHVLDLRDEMRVPDSPHMVAIQACIRKLISLVRMLGFGGFVSSQNTKVLGEALDELGNYLTSLKRSSMSESQTFTKEDLIGSEPRTAITDMSISVRDKDRDIGQLDRAGGNNGHIERSQKILSILGSDGEMGIRDIASNLPEYSEKMIQRELAVLVSQERVKKSGLKRWSRYSLVS